MKDLMKTYQVIPLLKQAWLDIGHTSEQGIKESIIKSKQKSCTVKAYGKSMYFFKERIKAGKTEQIDSFSLRSLMSTKNLKQTELGKQYFPTQQTPTGS